MRGLPTLLITVEPESSRVMHPPRAVHPVGFKLGNPLGPPHQPDLQRCVLRETLRHFEQLHMPGSIVEVSFGS